MAAREEGDDFASTVRGALATQSTPPGAGRGGEGFLLINSVQHDLWFGGPPGYAGAPSQRKPWVNKVAKVGSGGGNRTREVGGYGPPA